MISIVIVSWNVETLLRGCLQSIFENDLETPLEVIVVDNASSDQSVPMVQREFPQVKLIISQENLGFSGGNNRGVQQATGDFIFLLNPDTRLEKDTLAQLHTYLLANHSVGVVGPQLLWPDGTIQSSRRQFPSPVSLFLESTLLEQWFPHNRVAQAYKLNHIPPTAPHPVAWLVGAALFMRREVWTAVGPLDESLFMYFEETDWCRRCAETTWAIHYYPQAKVTHYEGQSSGQVVASRTLRFQRSKIGYAQKWLGRHWAILIRLFLIVTYIYQWLAETAKWLLGHKRALRRERMTTYQQVIYDLRRKSPLGIDD